MRFNSERERHGLIGSKTREPIECCVSKSFVDENQLDLFFTGDAGFQISSQRDVDPRVQQAYELLLRVNEENYLPGVKAAIACLEGTPVMYGIRISELARPMQSDTLSRQPLLVNCENSHDIEIISMSIDWMAR